MGLGHRVLLTGLTRAYAASLAPTMRRFLDAAADPYTTQARWLERFLARHQDTEQGRRLGFAGLGSIRAFQDQLPTTHYEHYRADVERIADGVERVLSPEPVRVLERSSGSTGGPKLVPYGQPLLDDFGAATGPWLYALYQHRPALHGTTSYWSVSPAARAEERTRGGLRIGFEDDTEYFDPLSRWALRQLLAVPPAVRNLHDVDEWRLATVRHLLADPDLGFISVWSPTFLSVLMTTLARRLDDLLLELPPERSASILRGLDRHGAITGPALWPRLRLVSTWADGPAATFIPELRRWFPGVELQPKGLLATEGVVSFPLTVTGPALPGAVLALTSHFLEFVDLDHPGERPRLAGELVVGGRYTPLLTTSGGLVRYALRDELRCVGHFRAAPLVQFVAKLDRVSDQVGEKLTGAEVDRILQPLLAKEGLNFGLLAPELGPPVRYHLFLEGASEEVAARLGAAVDQGLWANPHYRYARELAQLGPVAVVRIERGWTSYEAERIRRGQKAGDIKPTHLDPEPGWAAVFTRAAALTRPR